ncbi:glycosyltransferase family 2 protein [Paenibacillus rigui]|nr:glycosyltransferase family 2 protein [Paenibacillus rigui]
MYSSTVDALRQGHYAEAEQLAAALVRQEPLDGQGWVLLGEALQQQGFGLAARRVFDRAWLLDPEAAWVTRVHAALQQVPDGSPRGDVDALLQVEPVTVAAVIIAGNEERCIARCLRSLQGAVDEIVVIDSSSDGTAAIAESFPLVRLIRAEWQDDFARQRNVALAHVQSDWILMIDADEELVSDDVSYVRHIAGLFHATELPAVLHVWHLHQQGQQIRHDFSQTRLFPNRRGLEYRGRIHEQLAVAGQGLYEQATLRRIVRLRLRHDGYDPAVLRGKQTIERNLRLLAKQVAEEPDNPGAWLFYGRETMAAGRLEEAIRHLRKAEEAALQQPRFGRLLEVYRLLAQLAWRLGQGQKRLDEAAGYCLKALELQPDYPDARYMLAQIRLKQAEQLVQEAGRELKQAKESFRTYRGTVSPDYTILDGKADALLGDLMRQCGKLSEARELYRGVRGRFPQLEGLGARIAFIDRQQQKLNESHQSAPQGAAQAVSKPTANGE